VTEAVTRADSIHRGCSVWGVAGMAAHLLTLYPGLHKARVLRGWGVPTAFTPDDEPVVGQMPGWENLFVYGACLQTISTIPVLSD
ncbi:MAG: hypothetical protein ACP5TV_04710, partial [Anaerolineae bacterium]